MATQYIRIEVIRNKRVGLYRDAGMLVFSIGIGAEHTPPKTKFSGMRLLWHERMKGYILLRLDSSLWGPLL